MKRFAMVVALGAAALLVAPSQAARFSAGLAGSNENPPNASAATGSGFVELDPVTHTLRVQVTFSGLGSNTVMAHIHCCALPPTNAGVATTVPAFVGFPLGVTSGSFDGTFNTLDAGTWNPAYITANGGTPATAEAALLAGMLATSSYLNIHTVVFPGGEIRGQLVALTPTNVPTLAQGTLVALVASLLFIGFAMLRRRGN